MGRVHASLGFAYIIAATEWNCSLEREREREGRRGESNKAKMARGEGEDEAAAPFLETNSSAGSPVYFDGCPGCAMELKKAANPGIPYKLFIHIWIIMFVSSLPISLVYPFIYFMIEDLHITTREEDIGFYAGFVGAAYMFGRTLTATVWGMVADRIGRKLVIILGIFAVLVFNTLFGLSAYYWMALVTRFLLGALNGLLGPIRAYVVEVCQVEHQAIGLSLVSTAWAIALIIGPAIGGYLAQPTEKYPKLFDANSLFGRFPYFLPCLCVSIVCVIILISCMWLPETLHKHKRDDRGEQAARYSIGQLADFQESTEKHNSSTKNKNLFKNWPLMSSIILYCIISFDDSAYSEIFPLWAESDKKFGGLSFSTEDVGQVLIVAGASMLLYQTFIYPHIVKAHGPTNATRITAILSMMLIFTYPPMTHLSRPWLSIVVNIASSLKGIFVVMSYTNSFILQNNSVSQEQRATANGLSTTLMSFSKAISPVGAGIVFSWAQRRQVAFFFPGDQMVFFLLGVVVLTEFIWTFRPFLATPEQISSC